MQDNQFKRMHDQYQGAVDVEHNFVHLFMFLDRHTEFPGQFVRKLYLLNLKYISIPLQYSLDKVENKMYLNNKMENRSINKVWRLLTCDSLTFQPFQV